jgi:hypothetical protein
MNIRMQTALALAPALALGLAFAAAALPALRASGPARPKIVELYTSEGCSSCPPAEALLGELATRPDVVPLAFHVDYWDELGWRDRFSLSAATQRQQWWGGVLGLASVYTPQMIVEGRRSLLGSDRAAIEAALAEPGESIPVEAQLAAGQITVRVGAYSGPRKYDVYAIAFLPRAVTAIGRGENAGRTLTEWNIVRSLRKLGTVDGRVARFNVAANVFPADAKRLLVILQQDSLGVVAGAVVMELRSPS